MDWIPGALAALAAILLAVTFHEAAHGYAARALGDDTAARLGRLSLNPLRHVDPVGTLIVPGLLVGSQLLLSGRVDVLFGWAKPVPVLVSALRDPRYGMVLVAAAGPAINLVLAFAAALLLHGTWAAGPGGAWVSSFLLASVLANLVLAAFNMLPLPPLDGGRILGGLLPPSVGRPFLRLERFGLVLVLALIFLPPLLNPALDPLRWLVRNVVRPLGALVFRLAGHGP